MKTFAIMLDVRDRQAVVVGGGAVGLRKAEALAQAGATVRVIDPQPVAEPLPKGVAHVRQAYSADLLAGARLVFACTDSREVNARIAADARAAGALVNAADQPEDCDFFLPAVICQGDITVAIGTGGSSPALAADLKRRLAKAIPPRLDEFARFMGGLRKKLQEQSSDSSRRMDIMKRLIDGGAYDTFISAGPQAVEEMLRKLVKE